MATFTLRARGGRAVSDAWERYAVPERWSQWAPQIRSVTASADRLAVGVTGLVRPILGLPIPFTVIGYDEADRSWSWQVGWPLATMHLHHTVERYEGGSETTLRVSGPALIVVPYLPVAQWALRRLVSA